MGAIRLADRTVAALACPAGRKDALFFDTDLKGFGLRVTASGTRVFLIQYSAQGKLRRQPIGEWPMTTAAQARRLAETLRGRVRAGADPVAERRAQQKAALDAEAEAKRRRAADAFTVEVLIGQWQAGHLAERRPSYRAEAPRRVRAALVRWINMPAARLDRVAAVQILDAVKAADGPIAANRARAYARACFGWAVKRGALSANPFADVPRPSAERGRERVLSDVELGRVWRASASLGDPWRSILRLLMLTGQRRNEVAGMCWSELTLEPGGKAMWALPPERSKNGYTHVVPLSSAARDIVSAIPRLQGCALLFSQGRPRPPSGFGKMKARLDSVIMSAVAEETPAGMAAEPMPPWVLHDLRRSLATNLQRLGVRFEVCEAVLNHVSGSRSGVSGIYLRHTWADEKRAALAAWAAHVAGCAERVDGLSVAARHRGGRT